jgi:hypothetical protein
VVYIRKSQPSKQSHPEWRDIMKGIFRSVPILVALVLAFPVTVAIDVRGASAADDAGHATFRYLVGAGFTELGQVCDLGIPCPDGAMASNRDTIEISGEGTLRGPESVSGGGSFLHKNSAGHVLHVGTWTAKQLLSFESLGPGAGTPPTWEGGRALVLVRLVADEGGLEANAILEVGCELPGNPPGIIEGVRLKVVNGLNFNQAFEPRATLFINLGAAEGKDD